MHIYVFICVCIYTYTYTYVYVNACIHTHKTISVHIVAQAQQAYWKGEDSSPKKKSLHVRRRNLYLLKRALNLVLQTVE